MTQHLKETVQFERAKDLLLRMTKTIKQVATASGFRNEKSFMRAFQAWTATSPDDFRRKLAQRVVDRDNSSSRLAQLLL